MSIISIMQSQRGLDRWVENCLLPGGGFVPGESGIWLLQEPAGTTGAGSVKDLLGVNHGTPTGGVTFDESGPVIDGEILKAPTFDGGTSLIGSISNINIGTRDVSVFAWIKAANNQSTEFCGIFGASSTGATSMLPLYLGVTTQLRGHIAGAAYSPSSTNVLTNQWRFVGIVYARASLMTVYVDGVATGTQDISGSASAEILINQPVIGGNPYLLNKEFTGSIGPVCIVPGAWSAERIKMLYETAVKGI